VKNIFDCHCHFVTLEDFAIYQKTSSATKFINIRAINHEVLVKPYDFNTFKDFDNMYLTEAVDLEKLDLELERVETNLKNNVKIVGIKIYLGYQPFYANDERIKKVTRLAQKYGVSMLFHCGECYEDEKEITYSDAKYVEELAGKFKDVNFIASHINYPKCDHVFKLCEKYDNVFTCFSGLLDAEDEIEKEVLINEITTIINHAFLKYPKLKNKLMYGTDFFAHGENFRDVSAYLEVVKGLDLPEEEKINILHNNVFKAYQKLR